ncbi:hypothetical protein FRC10_004799 [Ceratobasidium sp. 414]|nr:hypothetical protein FRC10_004799 [Ceratobasidium sp. 414]
MTVLNSIMAAANETANAQPNPIEDLPFGYVPTGWVGVTFIVLFILTTGRVTLFISRICTTYLQPVTHLFQAAYFGIWYMVPTLALCGFCELLGWAGRYWGHLSPHDGNAFLMQICTTIIAPSFMTAAMFLILPKIMNELGPQYSSVQSRLYAKVFIAADITALVIQAAGGAIASIATDLKGANNGGKIMLIGIIIQLGKTLALILFTALGLEFVTRFSLDRPARRTPIQRLEVIRGWATVPKGVVWMLAALAFATFFILIRSVYRTIELTDGWNGQIISTEKWFNWFDGMPIVVAMVTFNMIHPGYLPRGLGKQQPIPLIGSDDRIELGAI